MNVHKKWACCSFGHGFRSGSFYKQCYVHLVNRFCGHTKRIKKNRTLFVILKGLNNVKFKLTMFNR